MIENTYYWLLVEDEEPALAYYYRNPDAFMNPEEPMVEGKDYSALGFGFNTADGGGFLFESDLSEATRVVKAQIEAV
jgi:hypothetical protein